MVGMQLGFPHWRKSVTESPGLTPRSTSTKGVPACAPAAGARLRRSGRRKQSFRMTGFLTRERSEGVDVDEVPVAVAGAVIAPGGTGGGALGEAAAPLVLGQRSEEHTSE